MNLTRLALSNPVAAVVGALLVILLGSLSLYQIPVQMIPTVIIPRINISTLWRAAAPEEIESEIVEPQEDALRGIAGVEKLVSTADPGSASITLTFAPGISVERALIEVVNGLNQIQRYPVDVGEPNVETGASDFSRNISILTLSLAEGNENPISGYQDFVEDVIQARLERINGVGRTIVFGERATEVRISFDPYKAAALGIDVPMLAELTGNNTDASSGFTDVGRRQYTVRFAGRYEVDELGDMVLTWRDGNPVRLRDIATVDLALVDQTELLVASGSSAIAVVILPEEGINVLSVMEEIRTAVAELQAGPVGREQLELTHSADVTIYIRQSITMLATNLLLGIALGIGILWWFLRHVSATTIVAIAVPVSLFGSFLALNLAGRSLNVISLAALAFAMGMVLDASIIVLENIVRLREKGVPSGVAAQQGPDQVWGALLASTITTVAIFLPILFMEDIAGQLFADLAFAISVAIIISLVIAVSLVPAAAGTWLTNAELSDRHTSWWERGTNWVMSATDTPRRRYSWIVGLVGVAAIVTIALKPPADYLPEGKQNIVEGFFLLPPGQSIETTQAELLDEFNSRIEPFMQGQRQPAIEEYYVGRFGSIGFLGMTLVDEARVDEFLELMNSELLRGFPDTLAFASRSSIFDFSEGGREIELNIQSGDIESILSAARNGMQLISEVLPGSQVRPDPGDRLAQPELLLVPDERRIAEVGFSRSRVARIAQALGDGLFVGEFFDGVKKRDVIVRGPTWQDPEELAALPLATPFGGVVPVRELMRVERTVGPDQIRRVDRRRTITLVVTPPPEVSLEEAIAVLREDVGPTLLASLPDDGELSYFGSADNLQIALSSMGQSFALAIVILYLLITALFRSFKDSFLVLLVLPLATVGGVVGLRLANLVAFQPMDLLTMIGFVTLLGLVVNNAILLVHQTRVLEREGTGRHDAVREAVRVRLRPILMSTLTSLFGMLPLLLIPGAGTELYRGMAAVIVGGMSVSTVFTLILLPSLLRLGASERDAVIGGELAKT